MIDELDLLPGGHRCRCVLLYDDTPIQHGNRCPHDAPQDAPFCARCEDRHPAEAENGVTVTVAPL